VSQRKRLGAWYTPSELIHAVATEVTHDFTPGTVVDPACGDGRFLVPFARACTLHGMDIDQRAIESVPDTVTVRCGDALTHEWAWGSFDAVVGNPPFLSQLSASTSRGGRSPFGGGPYADAAAEFLALALRLVRRGGRIGLVLPQSLLSSRDTAAIRAAVDDAAALRWMWWSDTHMFDAGVRVWAGVWEVGGAQGDVRRAFGPSFDALPPIPMPSSWSGLLSGEPLPDHDGDVLGDIATFSVDFRDQYYGLVGSVSDDANGPPLITSGLIDPGVCLWGQRPARFAGTRYQAPRVDLGRLPERLQRWARRRLVPKILIANQTTGIEAVHDSAGDWLPSVPVITCVTDEPQRVLDVLAGESALRFVRHHVAGSGLSARAVRLNPRLLASIPIIAAIR
jgi:SAM-dependent methyltransferase